MKFNDGKTFSPYVRPKLHSGYITLSISPCGLCTLTSTDLPKKEKLFSLKFWPPRGWQSMSIVSRFSCRPFVDFIEVFSLSTFTVVQTNWKFFSAYFHSIVWDYSMCRTTNKTRRNHMLCMSASALDNWPHNCSSFSTLHVSKRKLQHLLVNADVVWS